MLRILFGAVFALVLSAGTLLAEGGKTRITMVEPYILIVNEPVRRASAAKMSHSEGVRSATSAYREWTAAAAPPRVTHATNTFPGLRRDVAVLPRCVFTDPPELRWSCPR